MLPQVVSEHNSRDRGTSQTAHAPRPFRCSFSSYALCASSPDALRITKAVLTRHPAARGEAPASASRAIGEPLPCMGVPKLSDSESSAKVTLRPEFLRTLRGVCDALPPCSGDACSRAAAAPAARALFQASICAPPRVSAATSAQPFQ